MDPELARLLAAYRSAHRNWICGGPPGDGAWAYPEELQTALDRAEVAIVAYVNRLSQAAQ